MMGVAVSMLACLTAFSAGARELVREGFEGLDGPALARVPGRNGAGWRHPSGSTEPTNPVFVDLDVAAGGSGRGSISFDLQRPPHAVALDRETVFDLLNPNGESLLLFQVDWSAPENQARPKFRIRGGEFASMLGLWNQELWFDQNVGPEEWVHVDLTWDDRAGDYGLYLDGRPQDTSPRYYDASREAIVAGDSREAINQDFAERGEPPPYVLGRFGELLASTAKVRIGVFYDAGMDRGSTPLQNAALDNLVIVVDEPVELVGKLHGKDYDPQGLAGTHTPEGVRLTWGHPTVYAVNQGYFVYRRAGEEGKAKFEKLTPERVYDLAYLDTTAQSGESYRYSVTAVYTDERGREVESKYPPEVTVTAAARAVTSVAAEKGAYGAGQEIVVTLRGTPDQKATFSLARVADAVAMTEVDDGVYVGRVKVPAGKNLAEAALTGTLTDPASGEAARKGGPPVSVDTAAPAPVGRILASATWAGEIELAWDPSPAPDVAGYRIYRGEDRDPDLAGPPHETVTGSPFVDTGLLAGLTYRYQVVPVDRAGNAGLPSEIVSAPALGGDGPRLTAVTVEPFGRPAKPGQDVTLTATGQSGGTLTVDLGTAEGGGVLAQGLVLTEEGRTGRYVGHYTVQDPDVGSTKQAYRVVARLQDAYGASSLAGPELTVVGRDTLNDTTPPVIASARHDGWEVAGFSGKLVAGDLLTVSLEGEPGGYASFALPGVTRERVAMAETAPGRYAGTYTVPWEARGSAVPVEVYLADEAGNENTAAAGGTLSFDTRVRLDVTAREGLLPADQKTTTRLVAHARNANGADVAGHELALTLSTTDEYTGVVGGGRIEDREARMEDSDNVEIKWGGVTDAFGDVAATYTAGFAAKTALILAKDLTTGDVGVGWLNTYITATVAIELTARRAAKGAADLAVLRLTADPVKLTADGRSTSRLRAWLTDFAGTPLKGETIAFSLAGQNGRLKILDATTDAKGMAEAQYRAGTAIGTVTVTASAEKYAVTASVQLTLMSDAPAKLLLVASAKRLPADGSSTAELGVSVTDIHDNPNHEVPVTFRLLEGEGEVDPAELLTDRNGEGTATYIAGRRAGLAVIEARHTSRPPSEEEVRRACGTVFVPRLEERQERDRVRVKEWLVEPGDEVAEGQDLVVVASRRGTWGIAAPATGVFVRRVRYERDRVELGDSLGYVEIDPEVWSEAYAE